MASSREDKVGSGEWDVDFSLPTEARSANPLADFLFAGHMFACYLGKQFQGARLVVHFKACRMCGAAPIDNGDGAVCAGEIPVLDDVQIFCLQCKFTLLSACLAQHLDIAVQKYFIAPAGDDTAFGDGVYRRVHGG